MVHRPSDSRLLVNLLSHEKEYSKQLSTLLDQSQSCLASFSAYASASAPATSQIIIQVAGALAGADEGLRKYAGSLEQWQEQLKGLKELEDEVGNIVRDREILVTRLIKLAKSQKPTRDSLLASSSSSTLTKLPEVQTSTKLASAQSELQACEAHLAAKERELDVMRNVAVKFGLSARCKALVECGWSWGEMGKEGLRALECMDGTLHMNGNATANGHVSSPRPYKPLPDGPPSDLSSIGPSQSASQQTHAFSDSSLPTIPRLFIPPAHSISDNTFPTEEETGEGSSAGEEMDNGQFEVRENERFSQVSGKSKLASKPKANGSSKPIERPKYASMSSASFATYQPPSAKRQRKTSGSVLGSIAAFFHHKQSPDNEKRDDVDTPKNQRQIPKWQTRTDKHLARNGNGKAKDDTDSDDGFPIHSRTPVIMSSPLPLSSPTRPPASPSSASHRLKKSSGDSGKRKERGTSLSPVIEPGEHGNASGDTERRNSRRSKKVRKGPEAGLSSQDSGHESSTTAAHAPAAREVSRPPTFAPPPAKIKKSNSISKQGAGLPAALPTELPLSLSRNSSLSKRSITSAASAPVNLSNLSRGKSTIHPATTPHRHGSNVATHKRAASYDVKHDIASPTSGPAAKAHKRNVSGSSHVSMPSRVGASQTRGGEQSLMSIVEGVSRQNREHQDPNQLLFLPRAPPPVSTAHFLEMEESPTTSKAAQGPKSKSTPPLHVPKEKQRTPSERSLPITPSVSKHNAPGLHKPSPDLKPLRSAMRSRSTSRTPSPPIAPLTLSPPSVPPPPSMPPPAIPARSKLRPPPTPEMIVKALPGDSHPVNGVSNPNGNTPNGVVDDGDTSSISSYETTLEMPGEEDSDDNTDTPHPTPHLTSPPATFVAPALPPKDTRNITVGGSQLSQSTDSTATNSTNAPLRRKSVRMSLPPTFSTTPPAFDDNDEESGRGRRYDPWSPTVEVEPPAWRSKIKEPVEREVWQDSSGSEDEEYNKAKRLLNRVAKPKTKKKRAA